MEQHAGELAEKSRSRTVTAPNSSREKYSIAVLSLKALRISASPDGTELIYQLPTTASASLCS